jgi:hypothetical protein
MELEVKYLKIACEMYEWVKSHFTIFVSREIGWQ